MYTDHSLNFAMGLQFKPQPTGATIISGPNGPGLTYSLTQIHDPKDPWSQAWSWLNEALVKSKDQKPGLALVFGLGLGYHLKILRQAYPDIRLVVFEPIAEMIGVYESYTPFTPTDGAPPIIVTNWNDFEKTVKQELVYGDSSEIMTVALEPYKILKPEAFGAFSQYTNQQVIRRSVIDLTRKQTGPIFLQNLATNAALLPNIPNLMLLRTRLPAIPAFIVGSGPSLDLNVDILRQASKQGLILASSSALKPLLKKEVRPDVVLVLESEDTSDYLHLSPEEQEILGPDTILALASSCHPAHFTVPGFQQAVFHLTAGEAEIFSNGSFLPQGGNSGTAAFALAFAWGLRPLVLVAQDQAYHGTRLHAQGTPGEVVGQDYGLLTVAGINDTVVQTDTGLLASMTWFIESAKTIKSKNPSPPELYNASASGAHLPGFLEIPLDTIVASLPPLENKIKLADILPQMPRNSRQDIKADVSQIASIVGALRRLGRTQPLKALEEIKNACEMSKFIRQLLGTAMASTTPEELNGAMNQADELITLMLSSLQ